MPQLLGQPLEQWTEAIRDAYREARLTRAPVSIVADAKAGYRITEKPDPDDTILIGDITPPRWDDARERARIEAFLAFREAQPALERMAEIISGFSGDRRAIAEELAEEVMRQYSDLIIYKHDGPVITQSRGFFTRLFFGEG